MKSMIYKSIFIILTFALLGCTQKPSCINADEALTRLKNSTGSERELAEQEYEMKKNICQEFHEIKGKIRADKNQTSKQRILRLAFLHNKLNGSTILNCVLCRIDSSIGLKELSCRDVMNISDSGTDYEINKYKDAYQSLLSRNDSAKMYYSSIIGYKSVNFAKINAETKRKSDSINRIILDPTNKFKDDSYQASGKCRKIDELGSCLVKDVDTLIILPLDDPTKFDTIRLAYIDSIRKSIDALKWQFAFRKNDSSYCYFAINFEAKKMNQIELRNALMDIPDRQNEIHDIINLKGNTNYREKYLLARQELVKNYLHSIDEINQDSLHNIARRYNAAEYNLMKIQLQGDYQHILEKAFDYYEEKKPYCYRCWIRNDNCCNF